MHFQRPISQTTTSRTRISSAIPGPATALEPAGGQTDPDNTLVNLEPDTRGRVLRVLGILTHKPQVGKHPTDPSLQIKIPTYFSEAIRLVNLPQNCGDFPILTSNQLNKTRYVTRCAPEDSILVKASLNSLGIFAILHLSPYPTAGGLADHPDRGEAYQQGSEPIPQGNVGRGPGMTI